MQKRPPKKPISPGIAIVVIILVVVVLVVAWVVFSGGKKRRVKSVVVSQFQRQVDRGIQPPGRTRAQLEALGVKYPADFEQRAQKFQEELAARGLSGRSGGPMRGGR